MEDSSAMSRPREVSWARLLQATGELAPHWAVPPRLVALVDVDRSTEGRWQVRADRIVAGTPGNLALLADPIVSTMPRTSRPARANERTIEFLTAAWQSPLRGVGQPSGAHKVLATSKAVASIVVDRDCCATTATRVRVDLDDVAGRGMHRFYLPLRESAAPHLGQRPGWIEDGRLVTVGRAAS